MCFYLLNYIIYEQFIFCHWTMIAYISNFRFSIIFLYVCSFRIKISFVVTMNRYHILLSLVLICIFGKLNVLACGTDLMGKWGLARIMRTEREHLLWVIQNIKSSLISYIIFHPSQLHRKWCLHTWVRNVIWSENFLCSNWLELEQNQS